MSSQVELTVDVGILMVAFRLSHEIDADCDELICTIRDEPNHCVKTVIDDEGCIQHQYQEKLKDAGEKWLQLLASQGKLAVVPRATLPHHIKVRLLNELHMDPEDLKYYVRTAASTVSRLLVSRDDDYSEPVCRALRKWKGIQVIMPRSAVDRVEGACVEGQEPDR